MKQKFNLMEIVSFYFRALMAPSHMIPSDLDEIHRFFGIEVKMTGNEYSSEDYKKLEKAQEYLITNFPWIEDCEWGIITDNTSRMSFVQQKEKLYGKYHELNNIF